MQQLLCLLLIVTIVNAQCYDECSKYCGALTLAICGGCKEGAYHYSRLVSYCFRCKVGCLTCDDDYMCTSCATGYWLREFYKSGELKGKTCDKCPEGCSECSTPSQCSSCETGYYLSNGICKRCSYGCDQCNGPNSCNVCERGYGMKDGWCYKCSTDIECIECQEGTYLSDGSCHECPSLCTGCSSLNKCTGCVDGYYLNNGSCVPCSQSIEGCSTCSQDGSICYDCERLYRLKDNQCIKCPDSHSNEKVFMCNNENTPTICMDGYKLPYEGCQKCLGGDGCRFCHDWAPRTCYGCKDGYYLSGDNCYNCMDGCAWCDNADSCNRCADGYLLVDNHCVSLLYYHSLTNIRFLY